MSKSKGFKAPPPPPPPPKPSGHETHEWSRVSPTSAWPSHSDWTTERQPTHSCEGAMQAVNPTDPTGWGDDESAAISNLNTHAQVASEVNGEGVTAGRTIRLTNLLSTWHGAEISRASLTAWILDLFQRFGEVQDPPTIETVDGRCVATARFANEAAADNAVGALNGADNKSLVEYIGEDIAPLAEGERFFAEIILDDCLGIMGDADSKKEEMGLAQRASKARRYGLVGGGKAAAPSKAPALSVVAKQAGLVTNVVRITTPPPGWSHQDVEEMCRQYGLVDSVMPVRPSGYEVTYSSSAEAENAAHALNGLQAPPLAIYVDELQLLSGFPGSMDHEVFLRNLPVDDYTEKQLREWLDVFGAVKDAMFLENPISHKLSGCGYVHFCTHEEAAGLIASIAVDDSGASLQGSWSLSERLLQDSSGQLCAAIRDTLALQHQRLQVQTNFSALALMGDQHDGRHMHFAVWIGDPTEDTMSILHSRLAEVLAVALTHPSTATVSLSSPAPESKMGDVSWCEQVNSQDQSGQEQESQQERWFDEAQEVESGLEARRFEREDDDGTDFDKEQECGDGDKEDGGVEAEDDDEDDDDSMRPCILIQGFPKSWGKKQIQLVFALYGGVSAVHFVNDPIGRAARVELKDERKMVVAVEQLNGRQVGDRELIETCVLQCELFGCEEVPEEVVCGPMHRACFIDELPMPKRPDIAPSGRDREVFLQQLPRSSTEEDLCKWLGVFGPIEEVMLIDGDTHRKAYVSFQMHESAVKYMDSKILGEDDGVIATWSEAERAKQRALSVYRADVHSAFVEPNGQVLQSVLVRAKVGNLWVQSHVMRSKDQDAPPITGKQLHFSAMCDAETFEEVRAALSNVLEAFHARVVERLKWIPASRSQDAQKDDPSDLTIISAAAPPKDVPLANKSRKAKGEKKGAILQSPVGQGVVNEGKGKWSGKRKGTDKEKDRVLQDTRQQDLIEWGDMLMNDAIGKPRLVVNEKQKKWMERGEALVREGRAATAAGLYEKSYMKYCMGIQYMLDVIPEGDADPEIVSQRRSINVYLKEAEGLKSKMDKTETSLAVGDHAAMQSRVDECEALMREAHAFEAAGASEEAYDKCCKGLRCFLQLRKLAEESTDKEEFKAEISRHLVNADRLKERLERVGINVADLFGRSRQRSRSPPAFMVRVPKGKTPAPSMSSNNSGIACKSPEPRSEARSRSPRPWPKPHASTGKLQTKPSGIPASSTENYTKDVLLFPLKHPPPSSSRHALPPPNQQKQPLPVQPQQSRQQPLQSLQPLQPQLVVRPQQPKQKESHPAIQFSNQVSKGRGKGTAWPSPSTAHNPSAKMQIELRPP